MSENLSEMHGSTVNDTDFQLGERREPLSAVVVEAVAEAADVDPAELGTPLYEQIDPDALDNLFSDRHNGMPRGSGHVTFELLEFEVTVYSDGHVVVRE
ncbi:HalOD1 output domain-containing protein [Halorussus halophilus]|uniref:HalOD1 output domain-containing protein n=1 Tax=Halorussus halophilus TaxID=2650975 RepID=UPI001787D7B0|nr:HalOD1 output domain-containing protein [Halorussus halophilus]